MKNHIRRDNQTLQINKKWSSLKESQKQKIASEQDIHFIFDDNIPEIYFYTIPYIEKASNELIAKYEAEKKLLLSHEQK